MPVASPAADFNHRRARAATSPRADHVFRHVPADSHLGGGGLSRLSGRYLSPVSPVLGTADYYEHHHHHVRQYPLAQLCCGELLAADTRRAMSRVLSDPARLYELRQEYWRRLCYRELVQFCIPPGLEGRAAGSASPPNLHGVGGDRYGQTLRLMMSAPPGSAKTTYVSRIFPAWYFAPTAHTNLITTSQR